MPIVLGQQNASDSSRQSSDGVTAGNAVYPDANLHASCSHFMRVYQFKAAWGFSHLYDQVKHVEMQTIKYRVMDVLGNRTTYYRVHRGEKHLTPEMQEQVKKVFAEYGYGEPAYDHYAESGNATYRFGSQGETERFSAWNKLFHGMK